MKKLFIVLIGIMVFFSLKAQVALSPVSNDCHNPVKLSVFEETKYGLTVSPQDVGKIKELKASKNTNAKMNHTAYYLLTMELNGELVFDIVPQDSTNDYDFILYKYTDSTFSKNLAAGKINPLRANLSRNQKNGITGLSLTAKSTFVEKGIGSAYSKSIQVEKGSQYMLVLDNVYANGKGHTIKFNYYKNVDISGKIINEENVPMETNILFSDYQGTVLKKITTGKDGSYEIKTPIKENLNYILTFENDSSFLSTAIINTIKLKDDTVFPPLKTVLQKLKKGKKFTVGNINFYGNSPILLPASNPSVDALFHLMKANKKMIIQLEGHVNDPSYINSKDDDYQLSNNRCITVRNDLIKRGIDGKRITYKGLGASGLLYPYPENEAEMSANRRVVVNIVSLN
ncbi:MAG: OmpA family protein [Bacteroidia bacterium]